MRTVIAFGLFFWIAAIAIRGSDGVLSQAQSIIELHNPHDVYRLSNGHTLITDGGYPPGGSQPPGSDSRVLELDEQGEVAWSYSGDLNFAHNAQRLPNGNTLISDTGNGRVIEVNPSGVVVWNSDEVTLSDGSSLSYPNDVDWITPGNHLLITERDNHRIIEITRTGTILWQFGETGVLGGGSDHLNGPHNADRLPNGNTIVADSKNNRILEITPAGAIDWVYAPGGVDALNWPRDADRLGNGNTLITDSNHMRLLEVSPAKHVVWQYGDLNQPYSAERLALDHTLISKASRGRVIEIDEHNDIVWSYPPGLVDVDLPSSSTGTPTGTLAVRIDAPVPGASRYGDGAPAVIWISGGNECRELKHGLPDQADNLVILTFVFPGCTDRNNGQSSDGIYDYRGNDTILALADVIRYASGLLLDSQGRTVDLMTPVRVLHNNIGLIGASNGGNLILAVAARQGSDLYGHLRYAIQWETPVSSQIATRDLGRVWMKPYGAQGDYYNDRYLGYDPLLLPMNYQDLAYNPDEPYYPIFLDGSGDGAYTTIPDELDPTNPPDPDLNGDGILDTDSEDFPFDTYSDTLKVVYSRALSQAIEQADLFGGNWPVNIATAEEAAAYWDVRESVRLYQQALDHIPDLEGMVLASVIDHVQAMPGKPHIRQAFEGWDNAGAWVQINPSPDYMLEVAPELDALDLPDNAPNTPPGDWFVPESYCVPESIPNDGIYQLAAIWQMADRAYHPPVYLPLVGRIPYIQTR